MFRGFVSGLLWGAVAAVIGLGAVSLITPLPERVPPLAEAPPPEPVAPEAPVPEPEPVEVAEPAPVETADPLPAAEPEPVETAEPAPAPEPGPVETAEPAPPAPDPAPGALPGLPAAPSGALTLAPPPALAPAAPEPAPIPGPAAPEAAPQAALAPEPPAPGAAAPAPEIPVGAPPDAAPSRPGPEAGTSGPGLPPAPGGAGADGLAAASPAAPPPPTGTPAPETAVPETASPEPEPPEAAQAARPQPGFTGAVDGVRSNRLPRIGAAPPEPEAEQALQLDPETAPALRRNARAFANPDGKPPFAILLLDTGDTTLDLAALAASDVPVTLLVDPATPGATERAAIWRAAGQEVALLATALPHAAAATDMEVAMEALAAQFPQALALVDPAEGGMQGDRARAAALMPALRARGFGLVTWDRGLNPADQIARREGLPAVTIFRELDREAEAAPVVRRYLDRAAFKAQQDGQAVVFGRLRPETLTAVLEWALDGRAAALALAPLSAVLR